MRIEQEVLAGLPVLQPKELQRPICFVIDMVEGFVLHGPLSDSHISNLDQGIIALLSHIERAVFACDHHIPGAREFSSFPEHCLDATDESQIMESLRPYAKETIQKNSTNTFLAPAFQAQLAEYIAQHDDFVLVGCCTDICVMQFALTLNTYFNQEDLREKRVIVVADLVETYDAPWHAASEYNKIALALLQQSGVSVVSRIEE
ncbi:MAG: cysteine hydrolase family protein [Erysipelotrichaceae bacterium]